MGLFTALNEALGTTSWPPRQEASVWEEVELFAAFRSSNEERLRQEASVSWNARYMLSPVPRMISRASANLLYGEPPEIAAGAETDQENIERVVEENDLQAELHRGAMIASSEGEVWGRVVVAPDLVDVPIIEFVSRGRVIPHFRGRFLVGATFVTEWQTGSIERYRLLETYERGAVRSELYRGGPTTIGQQVDLDSFPPTAGREEVVFTGIEWPLATFIPNSIDASTSRGYADYAGLRDRFLGLNEAVTIGQANLRLAGRKRALVDAGYLNSRSQLPEGDDVFIRSSRQGGDDVKTSPLQVIDYDFQAAETVAWIDHLLDSTLTFAGVAPQAVGRSVEGGSISGTAMKLRMGHSLLEAAGKGRHFDRGLLRLLRAATIIDGRPTSEGGFGRSYAERDGIPTVTRQSGLPRDDVEAATQLTNLVAAEAISVEERVAFLHPDWTEDQRTDEVERLRAEQRLTELPAVE